ncbi:hypothetical protein PVL29_026937 [Vitis rotundifolia]|uniref:Uncharacterized protein n=1 Tax=Vitis rotundifolia TaxID=103349 RepID=A0AA39D4S6_VITRO|nr:hypothetical protein PVL29_026937 [Vitis rotundifolia]
MAAISFISTATVAPKNPGESTKRIEFNPWELQYLLLAPIQRGLLFRKPTLPQEHSIIDHLKTSLSRTLDLFYPLAGLLGTTVNDDNTTCFFINGNGAGVQFIHAAADGVTVGDILDPVYVPRVMSSFFPLHETRSFHGLSEPLFAVQVTELVDGIFGCTMNHVVSDGTSFQHFLNSWIFLSPVSKRWFVPHTQFAIRIPQSALVFGRPPSSPTQQRVFHFTKEKIAALKAKAKTEMCTNRISSLRALLTHLWRSVIHYYIFPIYMRPRVHPPLPQQYFGATIQGGTVTMKAGELLELGLGHTAWQMNEMISTVTKVEATNFCQSWAKNPNPFSRSNVTISNAFITSSSPRFNIYCTDFGWGRPVAVRSGGGNKFDGTITVFQGAEEGSIDIEACLSPETLEAMMEDAEFMEAV